MPINMLTSSIFSLLSLLRMSMILDKSMPSPIQLNWKTKIFLIQNMNGYLFSVIILDSDLNKNGDSKMTVLKFQTILSIPPRPNLKYNR